MSITKRLAIMAIFINIILLFLCPGIAVVGEYTGLRSILAALLPFAPLLAFVFLIVGCVPKQETASTKGVCRAGLFIVAFSLAAMGYCWDFGHNGVYNLFPDLQTADVKSVGICLGTVSERNITTIELDEADRAEVLSLLEQVTCRNPYNSYRQIRDELIPEGSNGDQFAVTMNDGTWFRLGAFPPYYVQYYEIGYTAADEEVCRQLADLYEELSVKYAASDLGVAAVD